MTLIILFFFFNDTATTEIYTLSLHDALPISHRRGARRDHGAQSGVLGAGAGHVLHQLGGHLAAAGGDRKSTRLNSSHSQISYAVFCLKKKKKKIQQILYITHRCVLQRMTDVL